MVKEANSLSIKRSATGN